MGYSSVIEVELILAQAMSSARANGSGQKLNLINVTSGNPTSVNRIPNDVIEYYITLADSQIDGILSTMYKIPLKKCARGQWALDSDINEYNQIVELSDSANLVPGDEILIRNDATGDEEVHTVSQVLDQHSVSTIDNIITNFSGDDIRVIRIDYPPPVNQISARFAASFIYDKYFAAQNDPNMSEYGKELRSIATGQLNDILNGRTTLECQIRINDRFGNAYIDSTFALYKHPQSFETNSRDMSRPK